MSTDAKPMLLVFVVFAAIVIIAVVANYLAARKRRQDWLRFAASMGWNYSADDIFGLPDLPHPTFQEGHSRRAYNIVCGTYRNREFKCFDYQYTVGSGKNSHTYILTCLLLTAPLPFVPLLIRPESFGDKLGHLVGLEDIDFESDEFNRKFFVKCQDKKFAYDVLHQRAMEFLLHHKPLVIEGALMTVLFHYYGETRLFLPTAVMALLDDGCNFLDLLPAYLVQDRMGRSPAQ
jgi:hypothetical protein